MGEEGVGNGTFNSSKPRSKVGGIASSSASPWHG